MIAPLLKQPREKSSAHLNFLRSLPCIICGRFDVTEAAHIAFGDRRAAKRPTGYGEKASDCWALPLCGDHHRAQHRMNEIQFWQFTKLDPIFLALALHRVSGDYEAGLMICEGAYGKAAQTEC
jgi:hypothetical protein